MIEGITKNLYPKRDINNTVLCFSANETNANLEQVFKDIAGEKHFEKVFSSFGYKPSFFFLNTANGSVLGVGVGRNNDLFMKTNYEGDDLVPDNYEGTDMDPCSDIENIISSIRETADLHYEYCGTPSHEYLINNGERCENCEGEECKECDYEGYTKESIKDRDEWSDNISKNKDQLENSLRQIFPNMICMDDISPSDW